MMVERRRTVLPFELVARVAIAWVVVSALLITIHWAAIAQGDVPGLGSGISFADAPLGLVSLVLTPVLGSDIAQTVGLVLTSLLTLGVAMILAAHIAWKLLGDEAASLTALILAISVPVLIQIAPSRLDYHGLQMICALAAINGLMSRSPQFGGWLTGASLAAWFAISLDGWPVIVAIFGVLAWRWLQDRNARQLAANTARSFAVFTAAFYGVMQWVAALGGGSGTTSMVHVVIFAWFAVALTLLSRLEPLPRGSVLLGFGFTVLGGVGLTLFAEPQWLAVAVAGADIASFWSRPPAASLQAAITPVIGIFAVLNLATQSQNWLRKFWFDYMIILIAALVASLFFAQVGAVACVLAAPPIAWQVRTWFRSIRSMPNPIPRAVALAGVSLALLPSLPFVVAGYASANFIAIPLMQ